MFSGTEIFKLFVSGHLKQTVEMFHDPGDVRMPLFTTKERTRTCSDL